jgi:hypothetical protein
MEVAILLPVRAVWRDRLLTNRSGAWASAVVALLLVVVMWPAWTATDRLAIGGDTLLIHYPWFVLWRDALGAGRLLMWNPYALGGCRCCRRSSQASAIRRTGC